MGIWQNFFSRGGEVVSQQAQLNSIGQRLQAELPELAEEDHVSLACLAGLLARVAFVDLNITESELHSMVEAITETTSYPASVARKVIAIAREEIEYLVDHEHHLYVRPLNELFDQRQKENTLKLLFRVAAADGHVENLESEEIRRISKELRLSHQQFVQAKLTVREYLLALSAS